MVAHIPTKRLILREWQETDQEALVRYANNRKVWRGLREIFPQTYSEKDAQWWVSHHRDNPRQHAFAIEYSREAIGGISLDQLEDVHQKTAELGYWLGEPFWGQGLGTEAVGGITDWGFANLDIIRIQACVYANNPASMRVMEKLGYQPEGCLKKSIFKDGQILDQIIYAKIKE